MKPIIRVRAIGKRYTIGRNPAYRTLRETLADAAMAPLRIARNALQQKTRARTAREEVWALRDVTFDVNPGEVLGVIGRNGAGKSTLLKILSRITDPTEGRAELEGRVGSLLEVGTGFHPELTGRENLFLSGAILGMRRAEITRKFDEIVDFAGVEKFIDTPVKHYSSGMYVRLAFAVAAHLETEILLVDEVLAVGDAAFQKKCLGKMNDIAHQGRTILFVSHNMAAVQSLCDRCLLFRAGQLGACGTPAEAITKYLSTEVSPAANAQSLVSHRGRRPNARPMMKAIVLADSESGDVRMGGPLSVAVSFVSEPGPIKPVLGLVVRTAFGAPVFTVNNKFIGGYSFDEPVRAGTMRCTIESLPLLPGTYSIDLYFGDPVQDYDIIEDALSFEVLPDDLFGTGKLPSSQWGPIFTAARFSLESADSSAASPGLQLVS